MSEHEECELSLVMPFVACRSNGGPHDDDAFTAGFECGRLYALLSVDHPLTFETTVRTDSVPQVDLIAMRYGYTVESVPWEDNPDAWTLVRLRRSLVTAV